MGVIRQMEERRELCLRYLESGAESGHTGLTFARYPAEDRTCSAGPLLQFTLGFNCEVIPYHFLDAPTHCGLFRLHQ